MAKVEVDETKRAFYREMAEYFTRLAEGNAEEPVATQDPPEMLEASNAAMQLYAQVGDKHLSAKQRIEIVEALHKIFDTVLVPPSDTGVKADAIRLVYYSLRDMLRAADLDSMKLKEKILEWTAVASDANKLLQLDLIGTPDRLRQQIIELSSVREDLKKAIDEQKKTLQEKWKF